jgi:hypothetical protein
MIKCLFGMPSKIDLLKIDIPDGYAQGRCDPKRFKPSGGGYNLDVLASKVQESKVSAQD